MLHKKNKKGERTLKASSEIESVYENGQIDSSSTTMGLYTTYVSPYMVVDADQKYSKHYFNGTQRVVSRIGEQTAEIFEQNLLKTTQTTNKRNETISDSTNNLDVLKSKQIADLNFYLGQNTATGKKVKVKFKEYKKQDVQTKSDTSKEMEVGNQEIQVAFYPEMFFYHSDHLGTGTFLSDTYGNPYQFFLNLPFGETMMEQHSYSADYTNRYKFNGKELDEETGFYYYGARYYNPKFSIWLSVDPLAEKFPNWNPYNYTMQNPINLTDPTGMSPEEGEGDPPPTVISRLLPLGTIYAEDGGGAWERREGWWKCLNDCGDDVIDETLITDQRPAEVYAYKRNFWGKLHDNFFGDILYQPLNGAYHLGQIFCGRTGNQIRNLDKTGSSVDDRMYGFLALASMGLSAEIKALRGASKAFKYLDDVAKTKGNFGVGSGTLDEAMAAGKNWVGDGYRIASDGKTMVSSDGLRQFRPPSYKPKLKKTQANFEWRKVNKGPWEGNGHFDVIEN